MGISSAVQWWENQQLRILVLSSLTVQWLLFIFAVRRKYVISYWSIRSFTWLAYLGSDALAIYALATLFNRQRKQDYSDANKKSVMELAWAPILLMHLGGQDCITAYNIEDNELWRRHVLTAVSKITVAIYVFCKSWPTGGNKAVLQVSILAFIPGILKCVEKPWALKSASINSLVSSSDVPIARKDNNIISLQEYVKKAKEIVDADSREGLSEAQTVDESTLAWGIRQPSHLFVDLASPYADRIVTLQSFWMLGTRQAYDLLQIGIYSTFDLLYTKIKMTFRNTPKTPQGRWSKILLYVFMCIRVLAYGLPLIATSLLPSNSDFPPIYFPSDPNTPYYIPKDFYDNDISITFVLLLCTSTLEHLPTFLGYLGLLRKLCCERRLLGIKRSPSMVNQYSLVGFFVRNQRHNIIMYIMSCFGCKDLIHQLWSMKSCSSSPQIIELVVKHVKKGWEDIQDATSYRKFNDRRGQWTLNQHQQQQLGWSIRRPFDESVLLWHIATDVCFSTTPSSSPHHGTAVGCREISQYMIYLLFVNPEMLLAGTRKQLFTMANAQLEKIIKGENQSTEEKIIIRFKSEQGSFSQEEGCFFHDALALANSLSSVGDKEMWEVIEGVWVEMLCYSASRCRGYLHAKGLGSGEEFLTYVWLLLSHMGMETLPEKLQGVEMEGNTSPAPSFSRSVPTLQVEHPSMEQNSSAASRTLRRTLSFDRSSFLY